MTRDHHNKGMHGLRSKTAGYVCSSILTLLLAASPAAARSIKGSKHDLSVTGPGPTKSPKEREICVFCHTPHGSSKEAPLWNRKSSGAVYIPYNSTTIKAKVGQPSGSSKLCLSCHDGTVALGMVKSRSEVIPFAGGVTTMPEGSANLGTDLRDDHPISFKYDGALVSKSGGELRDPKTLDQRIGLDRDQQLQCNTCHDVHDDTYGKFLVMDNRGSALCVACHQKDGWEASSHSRSTASWNRQGPNPWPASKNRSVQENACGSCHRPHSAGSQQRLLNHAQDEQNCFSCHNGNVASKNIEKDFGKPSRHDVVGFSEVHDPTEDLVNPKTRHVECSDCHNPHKATGAMAKAPHVAGALLGVPGIDLDGAKVPEIKYEYQLCFRCHADSLERGASYVTREIPQTNTRMEFKPGNSSYHPVASEGRNSNVPSLIDPLTESSFVYCSDCHSGSAGSKDSQSRGPHGSQWEPILVDQLVLTDFSKENASIYALCYRCHSRDSILGNQGFKYHGLHVRDKDTACTTCHDPHGVSGRSHLINFNLEYVTRHDGRINYTDTGNLTGSCTLTCHGKTHDNETY